MKKNLLLLWVMLTVVSVGAWGQIAAWQFGSPASVGSEETYSATTTNANLTVGALSRGAGVNTSALARGFSSTNFTASGTKPDAITNDQYMQFAFSANSSYKVSFSTLDVRLRRTSTGPNAYIWRYSIDGSTFTDIGTDISFTSTADGVDQTQIDLSEISALQNVESGTTITFRIYAWGASATSGTFAIGRYAASVTTNSLAIDGTVEAVEEGTPTKLVVTTINSGSNPSVNTVFDVVIQSQDNSSIPQNVSANTDITLSVGSGSGALGGTVTGTILAGQNSVTISGVTYNTAESGVSITATRTTGDVLTAGTSSTFTVLEAADHLAFVNVPAGGQPGINLSSFTVEARRGDNSVDLNYTGSINVAKASGTGNISGTLVHAAVSGVATFNNIQLDASEAYTLSASATSLTGATSGTINVLSTAIPLVDVFDYSQGTTAVSNGWSAHSSGGTNSITVGASPLTYSGYQSSNQGRSVSLTTSGEDINRLFDQQTADSVYSSVLVNVTSAQTSGDYFVHLREAPSGIFYARVFVKQDASNNLAFGISKGSTTVAYTGFTYALNTTYLIVVKYTFNTGSATDDEVSLWINPSLAGSEPVADQTQTDVTVTDAANIGAVCLRQGSASSAAALVVDGIRVGTSWSNHAPLPVELTSFTAIVKGEGVELTWQTATEINNYGFEVQRSEVSSQKSERDWKKIGFVGGYGASNSPKLYCFVDATAKGRVAYRLKQIDNDGKFEYSNEVEVMMSQIPQMFTLMQNHPNPFNPSTIIAYQLPSDGHVSLKVYNLLGQEVATMVNEVKDAGEHTAEFKAGRLASGIYFYTLRANNFAATKRMLLIK